ncbi:Hypothetical protein FKW44_009144 [Caligus rogercresseyi]|uniref:Uncharacterized protein n=1 Tax=Caligus rogercresseyi TaxID=217165 RepID=A0A7T8HFW3_CALRO|nr:Hypothetical protein FKW44_009144 [Caligus rogercresseyi]
MSFPSQQQQSADFAVASSWRSNPPPPPHPPHPDYNNFYYSNAGAAYSPFSTGDIRDSIAAIWSRTSPSGEVPLGGA